MNTSKQTKHGFILVTALLLSTLITTLILTMLEMGFLQMKMSRNLMKAEDRSTKMDFALKKIVQNNMQGNAHCVLQNSSDLAKKTYAFWESSVTCHARYNNNSFQYVLERLQETPCWVDAYKRSLRYERVTLRYPLRNGLSDVLVQATFLKPDGKQHAECQQQRVVASVIQSWRRLR